MNLREAVASETKKTARFRTLLKRLDTTLSKIELVLYRNGGLSKVLDRPEKETKMFILHLENGKRLVLKCSMVKCWNVYKKYVHANRLIRLDHELSGFFQVELQDNMSISMRNLTEVHALGDKMDQALSTVTNRAGGFSSSCSVPGLPDFIVGLDVHLRELKRMLLKDANQVLIVSAPGGCGKTTLAKMLCNDDEIKGIFGDSIFYVTVSRTTSIKAIVRKLAHHLHVTHCEFQTDEDAKNHLANMMSQMGSEKILLVLDDVWCESQSIIQDLGLPIPGYKILVTSRSLFSEFGSTYELRLLNDEYLLELSSRNLLNLIVARKDASELEGYCNEHFVMQHDLLRELAVYLSSQEPVPQRKRLLIEVLMQTTYPRGG